MHTTTSASDSIAGGGALYVDTDVLLALVKPNDWLKGDAEEAIRGERLRTSVISVLEAQLVLEREVSRTAALRVHAAVARRRVRLLPYSGRVAKEADRLRRKHASLNAFDAIHLATAKLARETILSSDALFPLIDEVPVRTIPDLPRS